MATVDHQNRVLEYQIKESEYYIYFLIYSLVPLFINLEVGEIRRLEEEGRKKEQAYEMRKKILTWLSPDDFEGTHQGHFKKRFENTGQWLLNDPRFKDWKDETKSKLLWCHGARRSYIYFIPICANLYISGLRENCISIWPL